jgi:hypothetical protein
MGLSERLRFGSRRDSISTPSVEQSFVNLKSKYEGTASLKKLIKSNMASGPDADGWLQPERALLQDFVGFYMKIANIPFGAYREYLGAANEADRRPLPGWMLFVFFILVIAESYAFNLLLADYVAFGASPDTQRIAAFGLSFLFSFIFVIVAHAAGGRQYLHTQAQHVFSLHQSARANAAGTKAEPAVPDCGLSPSTSKGIEPDKNADDEKYPSHTRIINRSEKLQKYLRNRQKPPRVDPGVAVAIVAFLIAMLSIFVFRVYDLNTKEANAAKVRQELSEYKDPQGSSPATIDGIVKPRDVAEAQNQSAKNLEEYASGEKRKAFYWAFGIFSVIFLGVQICGIILGARYGFISVHGERAFRATAKYGTEVEYNDAMEALRIDTINAAQSFLASLQQVITVMVTEREVTPEWSESVRKAQNRTALQYFAKAMDDREKVKILEEKANALNRSRSTSNST